MKFSFTVLVAIILMIISCSTTTSLERERTLVEKIENSDLLNEEIMTTSNFLVAEYEEDLNQSEGYKLELEEIKVRGLDSIQTQTNASVTEKEDDVQILVDNLDSEIKKETVQSENQRLDVTEIKTNSNEKEIAEEIEQTKQTGEYSMIKKEEINQYIEGNESAKAANEHQTEMVEKNEDMIVDNKLRVVLILILLMTLITCIEYHHYTKKDKRLSQ